MYNQYYEIFVNDLSTFEAEIFKTFKNVYLSPYKLDFLIQKCSPAQYRHGIICTPFFSFYKNQFIFVLSLIVRDFLGNDFNCP